MPEIPTVVSHAVLNAAAIPLQFALNALAAIESRETSSCLHAHYAVRHRITAPRNPWADILDPGLGKVWPETPETAAAGARNDNREFE